MMITCATCGRKQPLTDEDVALFHPRFFCLTCGSKLPFEISEAKLAELRRSNNRDSKLSAADIAQVPVEAARKVVRDEAAGSGGGG